MRKFIITICSFVLTCAIVLSGCSCANTSPLSFSTNFAGTAENAANLESSYLETLNYTVSYNKNYNASLKLDETIADLFTLDYNGTYTSIFKGDIVSFPEFIDTDISFEGDKHYIRTELNLKVTVNDKEYQDGIISEVYFYSAGQAFAPVYSKVISKNTMVAVSTSEKVLSAVQRLYLYETKYYEDEIITNKLAYNGENVADIDIYNLDQTLLTPFEEQTSSDYTLKQAIDNVQLIFAIRNINLDVEKTYNLPTVSPTYGAPKSLTITNQDELTYAFTNTFTYNGTPYENLKMTAKNMTFVIGGTSNVGTEQNVIVQKAKSDDFPYYNALPVEYAESLSEMSSFNRLGALVYKLTDATVTH